MMSEPETSPGPRGPASAFPRRPGDGIPSPATVMSTSVGSLEDGTASSGEAFIETRYLRTAVSPLAAMAAAVVAIAAAAWAVDWSKLAPGATDPVLSSEWWLNITSVLLPGEPLRASSFSQSRMWVALSLLMLAAAVLSAWVGRIGRNLRGNEAPFGAVLPLLAFPAWWMLPITLGTTDNVDRSRADFLLRYLVAFGILFTQFLILRWPLLNRIWRAGRLRYDLASIILWLPMMIPWSMIFLSTSFTYLSVGNDGDPADSPWVTTVTMYDWARNVTRATNLGIFVLLVVVTVAQHIGIHRDRAEERDRRAAREVNRIQI